MSAEPAAGDLLGAAPALAPDAPQGLGRMMAGSSAKAQRRWQDFYATPPEATRALLASVEGAALRQIAGGVHGRPIWEPCGRGGAILRELHAAGFATIASDVVADPDHQVRPLDLLQAEIALSPVVVTNPPFALAPAMIEHLLGRLEVRYVALLLKATFFHAEERRALFERRRPARIHALTWRLDFKGQGAPVMECAWFVWHRAWTGPTSYHLLPRPGARQEPLL